MGPTDTKDDAGHGYDRASPVVTMPQATARDRTEPSPSTLISPQTQSPSSPRPSTPTPEQVRDPAPPRPLAPRSTCTLELFEKTAAKFSVDNQVLRKPNVTRFLHESPSTTSTAEPDVTQAPSHDVQAKGTRQDGNK
ncbi:hypothetical protein PG985_009758 [Apiospora marii]|uniref:uncharacterized protein n=1 Tax=Apiospora marii TaxID=335849 RepID=UPI00313025DF